MKTLNRLAALTFAALATAAVAAPPCPAGSTPGSAECPAGGAGKRAAMQERLKAADTNHDGFISREEAKALPRIAERFDAIDTNKDGLVSGEELRAFHQAHKGEARGEMWKKLDANGDGRISRDEVAGHPKLAGAFDTIDTDKDGFLSPEELRAAHARHAGRGAPRS